MDEHAGEHGRGAGVDEGGVPAEESGVGELEEGAEQQVRQRDMGVVAEAGLEHVVDVRDAEVERGDEDEVGGGWCGCGACKCDGDEDGAEDEFLGDWGLEKRQVG